MKLLNILALILLFAAGLAAHEYKIDFVKSIGDEREDYTFFKINSIIMTDNTKDIYVADLAGHFISKYNWDGKFIKRIGQKGNGPGDFGIINSLDFYNNKLYIWDYENIRIATMEPDLTNLNYIKLQSKFFRYCFPIEGNRFIGDYFSISQNKGRIGIVNTEGDLIFHFFDKLPIKVDLKDRKIVFLSGLMTLNMNLSPERDKVLVSFSRPNNPIDFYIYNLKGELIKQFNYKIDEKFRFPGHLLNTQEPIPEKYYSLSVESVFFYKNNYIVFYSEISHLNEKEESENFCLIFNDSGEVIQKIKLDKNIYVFYLSNEGYLLGSDIDSDLSKVFIYQLKELKK